MSHLTRAQLLATARSLVLSADSDLAKVAATAELLAIDFYKRALASRRFNGDELEYLAAARDNEITHYDLLKEALGKATPSGLRFEDAERRLRATAPPAWRTRSGHERSYERGWSCATTYPALVGSSSNA